MKGMYRLLSWLHIWSFLLSSLSLGEKWVKEFLSSKEEEKRAGSTMSRLPFPLLLSLFFSLISSPALSAFNVTHLPGFLGHLPFHLETGYVGVDEANDVQLFYYFIQSERNPREDPLLLWLTGGPGCSALSGLLFEVGPLQILSAEYNGSLPTLAYKPYSWTTISNVIFLDSPVGTGFSFSTRSEGYEVGDITSSKQVSRFLTKWFTDHTQFLPNPLYIAGDSYAGKVVPIVAEEIAQGIEGGQLLLNLKGYLIGNPVTGEKVDFMSRVPFAHGVGIISDELYELTERYCEGEDYDDPLNASCATNLNIVKKFISEIYANHILEPKCAEASPKPKYASEGRRFVEEKHAEIILPPPIPELRCRVYAYYLAYYWANSNVTREALGIKKGTVEEWVRCNDDLPYAEEDLSNIKYQLNLTSRGYRALVYSGDHDMVTPLLGTVAWIKSLNLSIVDDWRSWHVGGQVAGYTRSYANNFTFATVKGGGHTAPEYRPRQCLAMITRWLSHRPL